MADDSQNARLEALLAQTLAGDRLAKEELFSTLAGRLERLARKMLAGFPGVARWEETDDVLQNALLRLLRALEEARPADVRQFLKLSTEMIRRELIDLARHFYGPQGQGAHHASQAGRDEALPPAHERSDVTFEPTALADWTDFHEQTRLLPDDEREVLDALFYQGITQGEAAELLKINVRTVQRRWQSALLRLHAALGNRWPGG